MQKFKLNLKSLSTVTSDTKKKITQIVTKKIGAGCATCGKK